MQKRGNFMEYNRQDDCIFCKILKGEIPSKKVYEDEKFIGILDVNPAARGHVIIISKNHAANVYELSEEDAKEAFVVAKRVATAVSKAYHPDGINILQNNGEAAGQTVFHLHIHIVPRYQDDKVMIEWEPKEISDLDKVMEDIKKEM